MNNYSKLFFLTIAEDQENYFTGDYKQFRNNFNNDSSQMVPGNYRIIDGELCQIISRLSPDEIREQFEK